MSGTRVLRFNIILIFCCCCFFLCMWRGHPSEWLQKRSSHRLSELSYLEVGLGSQSIHMEFDVSAAAYTLLVRDSARCKHFFNQLTGKCPPPQIHIQNHAIHILYTAFSPEVTGLSSFSKVLLQPSWEVSEPPNRIVSQTFLAPLYSTWRSLSPLVSTYV